MWDIGRRSITIGYVFLLDSVVFADLARAEFSDMRATWMAIKRSQTRSAGYHPLPARIMDRGPTAPSIPGRSHVRLTLCA
jgi:hypothetical protein